jgi:hypothetical protein
MNSLRRAAVIGLVAALAAVSLGLHSRTAQAQPQAQPHVYLFHGIFAFLSLGMDEMAETLKRRGINATVHNFDEWESVAAQAAAAYQAGTDDPIILIGHSLGANSVMKITNYLNNVNVPVALAVTFDSTDTYYAPKNVSRLLNFTRYFEMRRGPGFHGSLTNVNLKSDPQITHLNIDRTPRLQAWTINEVLAATSSDGSPANRGSVGNVAVAPPR